MRSLLTFALLLGVLSPLQAPAADQTTDKNIVELAVDAGSFKTLAAALEAADLVDALQGPGPFTVFAPTDEAFGQLPQGTVEELLKPANRDQLVAILKTHVVSGKIEATAALAAKSADSLEGESLEFKLEGGKFTVNGIRVINNDLRASNGVIHVIDRVLLPSRELEPSEAVISLFTRAIERGVPLFNEGAHGSCAAIYEIAVRSVVDRPQGVSDSAVKTLSRALRVVEKSHDEWENAWTLRRAMDAAMADLSERAMEAVGRSDRFETKTIFDFEQANDRWLTVNDDVMGGISLGYFQRSDEGTGFFKGALSLENNGGFATIRSAERDLGLAGYDGLILRVRGDGRTYGISALPTARRWEVNIWQAEFETVDGQWMEVRVPFEALTHRVMGQRRSTASLPGSRVRSIAFSISDKDEEPFELEIDWVKGYVATPGEGAGAIGRVAR